MASDGELDDCTVSQARANARAGERYRRKAVECKERAVAAASAAVRVNYLALAEYWADMAYDAEALDRIRAGAASPAPAEWRRGRREVLDSEPTT